MRNKTQIWLVAGFGGLTLLLLGYVCLSEQNDTPSMEFAPQMYYSVPYEPLSQVKDKEAGRWLTSRKEGAAEFYNSNPFNAHEMTMRPPVPGTVRHTEPGKNPRPLPYRIHKDSLKEAATVLKSPFKTNSTVILAGKILYERNCQHCHGKQGKGDGLVGKVYKGVPSYTSRAIRNVSLGHIFHVITYGKGRMGAHASQVEVLDRWRIAHYVQSLQKSNL